MQNRVPSQTEFFQEKLGERILCGCLRPGEILSESGLADEYGISRTPVREALRYLAAAGLVRLRPRKRPVVARLSIKDALDQFEMMGELEAACARLAARRRQEKTLQAMRDFNAACGEAAEANEPERYYEINERFHETIYAASDNVCLQQETKKLRNRMRLLRSAQGFAPGRIKASLVEHARIIDAIEAGDEDTAAMLMRRHLQIQGETLREMLVRAESDAELEPPTEVGTAQDPIRQRS